MGNLGIFVAAGFAVVGAAIALVGLSRAQRPALDFGQYLQDLDADTRLELTSEYHEKLAMPFLVRVIRPISGKALGSITRLTPRNYLEATHKKLLLAGLSGTMRAEEFVVAQLAGTGLLTVGAILYTVLANPAPRIGVLFMILAPSMGLLFPASWLSKRVTARAQAIRKDLPDTLDLLAISVEAGMGFEGALDIVTQHFHSPLAEEFARTLREMELGLPRADAFHNLKRRTEVPELSNFILALLQADALGIPIGRVLKTQATEMRSKRRMWARERAAKLPVKMLFPLILFIFPTIMIIVLAPAAKGIMQALS